MVVFGTVYPSLHCLIVVLKWLLHKDGFCSSTLRKAWKIVSKCYKFHATTRKSTKIGRVS